MELRTNTHTHTHKDKGTHTLSSKRKREEPEHQTIVINTLSSSGNLSKFAQETLKKPAFNNESKEKLAVKLNSLNDRKARSKSN